MGIIEGLLVAVAAPLFLAAIRWAYERMRPRTPDLVVTLVTGHPNGDYFRVANTGKSPVRAVRLTIPGREVWEAVPFVGLKSGGRVPREPMVLRWSCPLPSSQGDDGTASIGDLQPGQVSKETKRRSSPRYGPPYQATIAWKDGRGKERSKKIEIHAVHHTASRS